MRCSEPMTVTAVVPHEAVAGFAYEDLYCFACGANERRLIFQGTRTTAVQHDANPPSDPVVAPGVEPVIPGKGQPESSCDAPQDECPPSNPLRAAPAWARAIEKVRSRQADLHARAEEAKKADSAAQFKRAWEKLAPTPPEPAPPKAVQERTLSRRALRAEMRKLWRATSRQQPQQPTFDPKPEALARFNRFWESLVGGANIVAAPPAPDMSAPPVHPSPLPRYLSLVPVESLNTLETLQSMSDTTRAILLLAGLHRRVATGAPRVLKGASRRSAQE